MAAKVKNAKLSDLHQDDRNFNKGTEAGRELIRKSLRELGAGRSLLIDKNNKIIAGNKTHEGAEAVGLDDVIIVETDGSKVVAVKRTDIDIDTKKGREMALADNATVQVDLEWDTEAMQAAAEDFGIDLDDWGQGNPFDDERADGGNDRHQRDPDSEIIVATVSLFGTTEDMMLTQTLTTEEADKLIKLAKQEGAGNLMKRIIDAL